MFNPNQSLRLWVYGDIGGSGGYVRYCKGLFGMGNIPADIHATFVCSEHLYEQLRPLDPSVKVIIRDNPASPSRTRRYVWHLVTYPYLRAQSTPHVEFYPSGLIRPYLWRGLSVCTCHNQLLFDLAELAKLQSRPGYSDFFQYRKSQLESVRRADGVIVLSAHMMKALRLDFPDKQHVSVIPNAQDSTFSLPQPRSYAISNRPVLLYVSPLFPYKHHKEVILAVAHLRESLRLDVQLRLVGGGPTVDQEEIDTFVRSNHIGSWVHFVGAVDSGSLVREYQEADLFLFASSCEASSITLFEAMSMRLPIACSNRSGLPEVLRDAGVYFDPESVESIASAIIELLQDEDKRRRSGELALAYSSEFTWQRSAQHTFDFIRSVYEARQSRSATNQRG